jgi:hypothetical protein
MSHYRRASIEGGLYFFTVTLADRSSDLLVVRRVSDWPYSSFKHYVARGDLPPDWGGDVDELTGSFGE